MPLSQFPLSLSQADTPGGPSRVHAGLLGVLAAADIWLGMQLAGAVEAVLAQRHALVVSVLAAIGCAAMAGQGMILSWLVFDDLRESLRSARTAGRSLCVASRGTKSLVNDC